MKLRIRGNSVQLRLTSTDVLHVERDGRIECWVGFGPLQRFVYALELDPNIERLRADMQNDALTVSIPRSWVNGWSTTDRVGFESIQAIDGDQALHIVVEKEESPVRNAA